MTRRAPPEPVEVVKGRRDAALSALIARIPFVGFLDVQFDRRGDELTAILPFAPRLIGNPRLPALHGGATAGFLEVAAIVELAWSVIWDEIESARPEPAIDAAVPGPGVALPARLLRLPKTIGFTVDFLRSGLPRDAYARARVNRSGRRYASVHVEAWQDNRQRPFAQATGHFLMPAPRADGALEDAHDGAPLPASPIE
jgi:acyl-coenzyme A thioesterase PaaI-like protein